MKLNILSDLHLSLGALAAPENDADVVVLAGDVARPKEAIAWACALGKPVLYVAGNHEFYGGSIEATVAELKQLCAGTKVRVLDNDQVILGGVRFLGATLWTDFRLFTEGEKREAAIGQALELIRDFSRIRVGDADQRLFTPADSAALFDAHAAWIDRRLSEPYAGTTVVITHHAPSPRSIHPRFADSPLNVCFVSDAERLIDGRRTRLWIHGHTHDSFDYVVNGTRVVCNPRGYAKNGVNENPRFDPNSSPKSGDHRSVIPRSVSDDESAVCTALIRAKADPCTGSSPGPGRHSSMPHWTNSTGDVRFRHLACGRQAPSPFFFFI